MFAIRAIIVLQLPKQFSSAREMSGKICNQGQTVNIRRMNGASSAEIRWRYRTYGVSLEPGKRLKSCKMVDTRRVDPRIDHSADKRQ